MPGGAACGGRSGGMKLKLKGAVERAGHESGLEMHRNAEGLYSSPAVHGTAVNEQMYRIQGRIQKGLMGGGKFVFATYRRKV